MMNRTIQNYITRNSKYLFRTILLVSANLAALHNSYAEPQLRSASLQVVCGNAQEILTDLSKSPYKPFIFAVNGEVATWVFVDPSDGEMLVFRAQGGTACAVTGGIIRQRNTDIFKEANYEMHRMQ